jgi:hypothetical protein
MIVKRNIIFDNIMIIFFVIESPAFPKVYPAFLPGRQKRVAINGISPDMQIIGVRCPDAAPAAVIHGVIEYPEMMQRFFFCSIYVNTLSPKSRTG